MEATARRQPDTAYEHEVRIGDHRLTIDEPPDRGGGDAGPDPQKLLAASLAACTAITMEMYAARKGWELETVEVEVDYEPGERGEPARFELTLRLPAGLDADQLARLERIAGRCPVHRTLAGEVVFEQRVEPVP